MQQRNSELDDYPTFGGILKVLKMWLFTKGTCTKLIVPSVTQILSDSADVNFMKCNEKWVKKISRMWVLFLYISLIKYE